MAPHERACCLLLYAALMLCALLLHAASSTLACSFTLPPCTAHCFFMLPSRSACCALLSFQVAAGILVPSVHAGSPAEKAGLKPGDIIVGALSERHSSISIPQLFFFLRTLFLMRTLSVMCFLVENPHPRLCAHLCQHPLPLPLALALVPTSILPPLARRVCREQCGGHHQQPGQGPGRAHWQAHVAAGGAAGQLGDHAQHHSAGGRRRAPLTGRRVLLLGAPCAGVLAACLPAQRAARAGCAGKVCAWRVQCL